MEIYLIGLAVALVGGLLMSRLTRLLHLPAVTAYLVAGLLLGPFFLGRLNVPGLGFNTLEEVNVLSIVSQTALGFIAFAMGNEFRLSQLRTIGSRAIIIGILQAVITTVVVDVVLLLLHLFFPRRSGENKATVLTLPGGSLSRVNCTFASLKGIALGGPRTFTSGTTLTLYGIR